MASEKKSKPEVTAGCDSQVLMWAFPWAMRPDKKKSRGSQDVPQMRLRAKILMRLLEERGIQLCVPSVVVSELLAGIDPRKYASILAEFEDRFFCPPFDIKASALAATLWQFERGLPGTPNKGLPAAERTERPIFKSDILIVASARIAGASLFYSHDGKCRRLAEQAGMAAADLPHSSGNFVTDQELAEAEEKERND